MNDILNVISLGAGVQSSTMALMAARGEITPMPDCAVFADTQAEPPSVYKWLDWLEKQLPFPTHRVTQGSLEEAELKLRTSKKSGHVYRKALIPAYTDKGGMSIRKCTYDYKIVPIRRFIRHMLDIKGKRIKEVRAVQWIGISIDEVHRMKPTGEVWLENRWPLVDIKMSRYGCLEWWAKNKLPTPPRSACYFCPFHSDAEWKRLRKEEPEEFAKAIEFEKKANIVADQETGSRRVKIFLHASRVPLSTVEFAEAGKGLFGNECEGLCGV
jgi:hypothetical protein